MALLLTIALTAVPATPATALGAAGEPASGPTDLVCPSKTPHPPIQIEGDRAFRAGPVVGVRNPAAEGTAEDPFVIAGWCITGFPRVAGFGEGAIQIKDTDAHVVVRDNVVDANRTLPVLGERFAAFHGILVEDANNVTIESNVVQNYHLDGIDAGFSENVTIRANTIRNVGFGGVRGNFLENASVVGNDVQDSGAGIWIENSRSTLVADNDVEGHETDGIDLADTHQVTVRDNRVADSRFGQGVIVRSGASQVVIENNTVEENDHAVEVDESQEITIRGNTLQDSRGETVEIDETTSVLVEANGIRDGAFGVEINGSRDVQVTANNIEDHEHEALEIGLGDETVDARDNWWGASDGPSGGVEDACTDAEANGTGGPIALWRSEGVCFDPWLSAPNPAAGAG